MDKQIAKELEEMTRLEKNLEKIDYACAPDAEAAAGRISPPTLHKEGGDGDPTPASVWQGATKGRQDPDAQGDAIRLEDLDTTQ